MIQRHMPLGYRIENGRAVLVPETVMIVKRIFDAYVSGISTYRIAKELTAQGILNARHKPSWNHGSIGKILENRKYLGDKFYPPMIDEDLFEQAQKLRMDRQVQLGRSIQPNRFANRHTFSGKLRCGKCGQPYNRYVEHCNQPGETVNWKCKQYIQGNRVSCRNQFVMDEQIKEAFLEVINRVIAKPGLIDRRRRAQLPAGRRAAEEKLTEQIRNMEQLRRRKSRALCLRGRNCSINSQSLMIMATRRIKLNGHWQTLDSNQNLMTHYSDRPSGRL